MISQPTEVFIMQLHEALTPCADACELNGPAFYMLAQELADTSGDLEDLTLGELAKAMSRARQRYERMCERLDSEGVLP